MSLVAVTCREGRHGHCGMSGCGCSCHLSEREERDLVRSAMKCRERPTTKPTPVTTVADVPRYSGSRGDGVGYRGPDVCKLVGCSYRQLDYWDRTDLAKPSVSAARGSGTHRLYSKLDVRRLLVIQALVDNGSSLQQARLIVEALDAEPERWNHSFLIYGDRRTTTAKNAAEVARVLVAAPQSIVVVLDLDVVAAPLDRAVAS